MFRIKKTSKSSMMRRFSLEMKKLKMNKLKNKAKMMIQLMFITICKKMVMYI